MESTQIVIDISFLKEKKNRKLRSFRFFFESNCLIPEVKRHASSS